MMLIFRLLVSIMVGIITLTGLYIFQIYICLRDVTHNTEIHDLVVYRKWALQVDRVVCGQSTGHIGLTVLLFIGHYKD